MASDGGDCGGRELFLFELRGESDYIRFLLGLFSGSSLPPQTPSVPCKTQGFVVLALPCDKETCEGTGFNQNARPRSVVPQGRHSTTPSKFTLRDLKDRANQQQLRVDFEAYPDGFSPNVQDILTNFEFRNIIPRLSKADALGTMIAKFLDPEINLSPNLVLNGDCTVKHPPMDNHSMGTVFEEIVQSRAAYGKSLLA